VKTIFSGAWFPGREETFSYLCKPEDWTRGQRDSCTVKSQTSEATDDAYTVGIGSTLPGMGLVHRARQ
jgi:hypothetical protein